MNIIEQMKVDVAYILKNSSRFLLQSIITLCLLGSLGIFLYSTPYFSAVTLKLLNKIPHPINTTASHGQQGNLSAQVDKPTGIPKWIAKDVTIQTEVSSKSNYKSSSDTNATANSTAATATTSENMPAQESPNLQPDTFSDQIKHIITPFEDDTDITLPPDLFLTEDEQSPQAELINPKAAQVIVVLGGGLMRDQHNQIAINHYTAFRLAEGVKVKRETNLPLLLSGVEAPYMQNWLRSIHQTAVYKEAKSLNTCENARFTALLLLKYGGTHTVHLVTDAYHMPRARRLFADNGIEVIEHIAPLPQYKNMGWPNKNITIRSRRALYELIANARDELVGTTNCREVP